MVGRGRCIVGVLVANVQSVVPVASWVVVSCAQTLSAVATAHVACMLVCNSGE